MRKLLGRPSPALVVACVALLVALGGTSIAAVSQLAKNSVGTAQLKNNAVTTPKVKNATVNASKIANNAVVAAKIASNAVGNAKIAGNAVNSAKIADGSVAAADLAQGVIPAPSNAFARFVNGPTPVPDALSEIANLSIPQAGNYVISAKAYLMRGAAASGNDVVTCRLEAATDADESKTTVVPDSPVTISNLVVHNFTAAGSVSFRCDRSAPVGTDAFQIKIAAISVGNLTNSG
jgi:hypothetical protein